MHSLYSRLNGFFFFAVSTLGILAALCYVSSTFLEHNAAVNNVSIVNVRALRKVQCDPRDYYCRSNRPKDRAEITLDIHADLRNTFDWNTHQLFAYVVVEYATKKHPLNQVVVWDRIIRSEAEALLQEDNIMPKYPLRHRSTGLKSKNITARLEWEVMPISGPIGLASLGATHGSTTTLPSTYTQAQAACK